MYFLSTHIQGLSITQPVDNRLVFVAFWLFSCYKFAVHNSRLWELSGLLSPYMTLSKYIVISVSETVHGLSAKYGRTKGTFVRAVLIYYHY